MQVVNAVSAKGDRFWRQADKMLTFPEVKGLCIGYSSRSTSGSGMGPGLRAKLLESVVEISNAGVKNPALFELVGIFEDGIGPDRISDMVAKIIAPDLIRFTQRVASDCGLCMKPFRLAAVGVEEDLPFDPATDEPVILVPMGILKDLPVAESFADVGWIAEQNQALRSELSSIVGSSWKELTLSEQKRTLREKFIERPDILARIIAAYLDAEVRPYDFKDDRAGEVIWYRASKEIAGARPLKLTLTEAPTVAEVEGVVSQICEHFRVLVEENQLCRLLYDKGGYRKHESAAQLLFFGVASAYCAANDLDLSPESDAGRGPVDFKMSRGFGGKVLVEVKLTSNSQLRHGYEKQLEAYKGAEGARRSTYLVIDNGGASQARIDSFRELVGNAPSSSPKLVWVDGIPRPSASKS